MLKANTLAELIKLMEVSEAGQVIGVSKELFNKFLKDDIYPPFVQINEQRDEVKVTYCENKDQAQALANFLWNEKERHKKDIDSIDDDLHVLYYEWRVVPSEKREFVKPHSVDRYKISTP